MEEKQYMLEQKIADENMILKVTTGSRLYGTEVKGSDWDKQAIFIPPKKYVYGLHSCDQVKKSTEEGDFTSYSFIKYIRLAMANNPNILSILYTPDKDVLYSNSYGKLLKGKKHLFLSKKSYHTFRGYANSQRKKILTKQAEGKRLELIKKYGYDTKFAMHLVRLLYEALDIMVGHELIYPCPQRGQLKQIRNGEWKLEKVLAEADRIEHLVDEAYVKSDLQYSADKDKIEKLQMDVLESFWRKHG